MYLRKFQAILWITKTQSAELKTVLANLMDSKILRISKTLLVKRV